MFGFLKDKLKNAISKFTKDVKEEVDEKVEEQPEEKKPQKKEIPKKIEQPKEKKVVREDKKKDIPQKEKQKVAEKKEEPKHISKEEKKAEIRKPETKPAVKEEKKPEVVVKKSEEKVEHRKPEIKHVEEKKHHKNVAKEENIAEPKKGFFGKLFSKKEEEKIKPQKPVVLEEKEKPKTVEKIEEEIEKEVVEEKEEVVEEKEPEVIEKKGFFEKLSEVVTKKTLSESKFEELFFELEVAMLENNVAVEVIEKIKDDLKKTLMSEKVSRMKTEVIVAESLKRSIDELFDIEKVNILKEARKKKPYVICFVGVNGSGKTTNLAKLANYLQKNGLSVVIAACDTFRAAAIQQVEEHANNLGIKLIKHDYGADAAAVAYDAIEHAKAKGKDVVLIDTAGRSHSNTNLMEELEKVVRVSKPDLKIFVGDSLTGNDAVEQAKTFNERVTIDGIILSKVDVDEKGGAAISVSYVTQKPIMFIGTGQTYDDLEEFDKDKIIRNLGF